MLTRTIYIVRHGDALDCDEEKILLDEDRPLSELGHAQSAALGTYLAGRGAKIGEVATSPLLRARQTARGMLSGLGLDETKMVLCDELAPGVRVKRLADYLQRLDADDFVIVGHQPDLCEMLGWLIGSKKARVALSKAGVACVRVETPSFIKGCGELVWLATPASFMPSANGDHA